MPLIKLSQDDHFGAISQEMAWYDVSQKSNTISEVPIVEERNYETFSNPNILENKTKTEFIL